jgi:uncharacterized protein GlcG (DUF336 family)
MPMRTAAIAAAALALALPASAQTARPMLDYASAAKIRDACLSWAGERKLNVAVAVFDETGRLITFAFMDGTATAVAGFAQWKGKSAATVHVASKETADWGKVPDGVATWEGGTPIFSADGVPLGGVGVSGAASADDSGCGQAGIAAAGLKFTAQ